MTWTYNQSPGTTTADNRKDAVRATVGDTDESDKLIDDEEIQFFLTQTSNDIVRAAAKTARAIAAKLSKFVDTRVEGVAISSSQRADKFIMLAKQLEYDSGKKPAFGAAAAAAGGISNAQIDSNRQDTDRPSPAFERGQFRVKPIRDDLNESN